MAKKRIVSSKKNVPSHALSSKEAALQGRAAERDDDDSAAVPDSPVSSRDSSVLSSDDEGDADMKGDDEATTVAVEVMPASVGRGKQLRFPAIVSRGKEARVLPDSDVDAGSDSDESLLSIESEEEEDQPSQEPPASSQSTEPPAPVTEAIADSHQLSPPVAPTVEDSSPVSAASYPIKAVRARKRHRPDSGYYKQMSTYVRDCLLSVRDGGEAADVFREEAHHAEFRRRLEDGTVERVTWKEPPPNDPVDTTPPVATGDSAAKTSSSSSSSRKDAKKSAPSSPEKDSSRRLDDVRVPKKARSESSRRRHASSSDKPKSSSSRSSSNAPASSPPTSTSNGTPAKPKTASSSTQTDALLDPPPSSSALCSKCKDPIKSESAASDAAKLKKEPAESSPPTKMKTEKESSTAAASMEARPAVTEGSFTIPPSGSRDVTRLRNEAEQLNKEARRLKHEGNRRGTSVAGAKGQVAQATYYLRSGAKFFEHALKLQDVKAAYKELGDNQHARTYGEYSITTLTQTSSLIESTLRTFQSAGNTRLVALGYKMASVVHLAIYRLQHLKLFSLYSETFTPGRSPEIRANGTTPPISGGPEGGSKDAAVRAHLLKEMEHTLRGFEMWRRYEACKVAVLPRVVNPAVTDLGVFFEDLNAELGSSSSAGSSSA